jgi:hypothetical protein
MTRSPQFPRFHHLLDSARASFRSSPHFPDSALATVHIMAYIAPMQRHNVTLSEPVSEMVRAQVKSGRYKDFSAALQDAAWNFFYGPPSPFEEYGVTSRQVERTAQRDLAAIRKDRKAGKLKPWKPRL